MAEGDTSDHAGPAVGAESGHDIHSAETPQADRSTYRPTDLEDGGPSAIPTAAAAPESVAGEPAAVAGTRDAAMGVTGAHSDTLVGEGAMAGGGFKHGATNLAGGPLIRSTAEPGLERAAVNGSSHKGGVPDSIMLAKKRALSDLRKAASQNLQHCFPAGSETDLETAAAIVPSHDQSTRAIEARATKDDVTPQSQEVPFWPEAITAAEAGTGCTVQASTEIGGQLELAVNATAAELGDARYQADSGEHAAMCMILQVLRKCRHS